MTINLLAFYETIEEILYICEVSFVFLPIRKSNKSQPKINGEIAVAKETYGWELFEDTAVSCVSESVDSESITKGNLRRILTFTG